jgi:hypothetical protein
LAGVTVFPFGPHCFPTTQLHLCNRMTLPSQPSSQMMSPSRTRSFVIFEQSFLTTNLGKKGMCVVTNTPKECVWLQTTRDTSTESTRTSRTHILDMFLYKSKPHSWRFRNDTYTQSRLFYSIPVKHSSA